MIVEFWYGTCAGSNELDYTYKELINYKPAPSLLITWLSFADLILYRQLENKFDMQYLEIKYPGMPRPKSGEFYNFFMNKVDYIEL